MDRKIHTAINGVIGSIIGYVVASRSLDQAGAVKSALLSGAITAIIAWFTHTHPLADNEVESGEAETV